MLPGVVKQALIAGQGTSGVTKSPIIIQRYMHIAVVILLLSGFSYLHIGHMNMHYIFTSHLAIKETCQGPTPVRLMVTKCQRKTW